MLANIDAIAEKSVTTVVKSSSTHKRATFAPGLTTETDLMPLTPYWDEHMTKLDIHIPLTIFNVDWINRDLLVAVKNSTKSKDKRTGQLPKNEWWMSYSDWTRATRLFVKYLKEVYQHKEFAIAWAVHLSIKFVLHNASLTVYFHSLEKHFAYVIELDELHEWVTAFRYDIAVRANVMCHHVNGSVADPSVRRPRFLDAARAKTESFKDGWIRRHDNPYMKGGEKERFNPLTGERYDKTQSHDVNELEFDLETSTSTIMTRPREAYTLRRGRGGMLKVEGKRWKDRKSVSPYNRQNSEQKQPNVASTSKDKAA